MKAVIKKVLPQGLIRHIRLKPILKSHLKVAGYWEEVVQKYHKGEIKKWNFEAKKTVPQKVIWQYWGQGVEDRSALPEVVQICFDSVNRHKGEYEVIRLSDETIKEYIDLPQFVFDKLNNNKQFTRTFFSDLLRVALLAIYGGVWLDATILLTGELSEEYAQLDYFMYQRSDEENHKRYWENVYAPYFSWHKEFKVKLLNSIIFSKRDNIVIKTILNLLLYFWEQEQEIQEYFFFQILYQVLVEGTLAKYRCPIENDCIPHIIQTKINGDFPYYTFEEAMAMTTMHKMAYYDEEGIKKLRSILSYE